MKKQSLVKESGFCIDLLNIEEEYIEYLSCNEDAPTSNNKLKLNDL